MRVETAVVNMVEAARNQDITPERLAKTLDLAIEKVASMSPAGQQALKIISTNLVKDLLKQELGVVARIAKGPRAPRGSKKAADADVTAGPIAKEKTFEDEIADAFTKPLKTRKPRTVARKPRQKRVSAEEVT